MMGLFGKFFEKKVCAFCGKDIGLLGNRKLEDGNMCKECARKLSPWFSERRHSTVEEIRGQLAYREANLEKVKVFHPTRTLGDNIKIIFDEDAQVFVVTSARDLVEDNPDVLSYQDVTGCLVDVDEERYELKKEDKDGNEISYQPPRYMKKFDFYVTIQVSNPYFDEIRFKLNNNSVEYEENNQNNFVGMLNGLMGREHQEVAYYRQMGEDIKNTLMQARESGREALKPKQAVTCSCCGATTIPDAQGCCEYCGGKA